MKLMAFHEQKVNIKKITGICLLLVLGTGCVPPPGTMEAYRNINILKGSKQAVQSLQPIGFEEEKSIGGALAIQVFNRFGGMYNDPQLQKYITLVGQAVADVSDRPEIDYYFAVVNSEHPNAFATPGGYVFVSIGLIRMLENEAQLAAVLGHEIAHITHKHALHTLERNKKLAGFGSLTVAALGQDPALFDKVIEQAAEIIFTHGLDKGLEYEADQVGTDYATRLGYYPGGLQDFLATLKKSQPGNSSVFMSTHPSPQDRYANLSGIMGNYKTVLTQPKLAKEFQEAVAGRI